MEVEGGQILNVLSSTF